MQISSNTALKTIDANAISDPKRLKPKSHRGLKQNGAGAPPTSVWPKKGDFGVKKG